MLYLTDIHTAVLKKRQNSHLVLNRAARTATEYQNSKQPPARSGNVFAREAG